MSTFVLCVGCGDPLYGFSPCRRCTCEWCGNDLLDGFCLLCNSRNSCVYDPNPNSFDFPPDSYHPPHPTYETYSCESYGNDSHFGYDCLPLIPLNYESEPGYIENYNSYPYDLSSFPQQYLCCENCGGPHETFQCQPMNQNFYNSNSLGFDQSQPSWFLVIHQPPQEMSIQEMEDLKQQYLDEMKRLINSEYRDEIKIDELKGNFNSMSIEINKKEKLQQLEQVANLSTYPSKRFNSFCYDDDDDEDYIIAVTPSLSTEEPNNSLSMGDEHPDTISKTESDEFIKFSVETLVPILSESEGESECDVPAREEFTTFSNILYDAEYEFDSSDDQSFYDEDVPEKIFLNPLFEEEITPIKIDQHHYNAESDLIESLRTHDSSIIISSKIDSLLDEFAGELTLLKSIPSGIDETDCDPEEEIHLIERLLYDNSSPRPPEEFVSDNFETEIESFSPSPIPVKDIDSLMEEIDLSFTPDYPMPPGIEDDDYDSERDILIVKDLLSNDTLSLPEKESFHFDIPSFSRPLAKPPDGST
nr:hypothetical protein [Tanacetum cinerariifolium]